MIAMHMYVKSNKTWACPDNATSATFTIGEHHHNTPQRKAETDSDRKRKGNDGYRRRADLHYCFPPPLHPDERQWVVRKRKENKNEFARIACQGCLIE